MKREKYIRDRKTESDHIDKIPISRDQMECGDNIYLFESLDSVSAVDLQLTVRKNAIG